MNDNALKIAEITIIAFLSFSLIIATLIDVWIANKNIKTQKLIYNSQLKVKVKKLEIYLNLNEMKKIIKNHYEKIKNLKENNPIFMNHDNSKFVNRFKNTQINLIVNDTNEMLWKIDSKNRKLLEEIKKELQN